MSLNGWKQKNNGCNCIISPFMKFIRLSPPKIAMKLPLITPIRYISVPLILIELYWTPRLNIHGSLEHHAKWLTNPLPTALKVLLIAVMLQITADHSPAPAYITKRSRITKWSILEARCLLGRPCSLENQ